MTSTVESKREQSFVGAGAGAGSASVATQNSDDYGRYGRKIPNDYRMIMALWETATFENEEARKSAPSPTVMVYDPYRGDSRSELEIVVSKEINAKVPRDYKGWVVPNAIVSYHKIAGKVIYVTHIMEKEARVDEGQYDKAYGKGAVEKAIRLYEAAVKRDVKAYEETFKKMIDSAYDQACKA